MRGTPAPLSCALPTKYPSLYQTLTYLFFLFQNYIYESQIGALLQPSFLTIILETWRYILILFLVYEVLMVTNSDTRDPLLQVPESEEDYDANDLVYCMLCNAIVLKSSYHCWRCNQCSYNLDHHCKFLNCCIAATNYLHFLRLLAIFIFYSSVFVTLIYLGSSFTVLIWCIMGVTMLELLLAVALFIFHIYLGWCYNGSTLNFYNKQSKNKTTPIELKE